MAEVCVDKTKKYYTNPVTLLRLDFFVSLFEILKEVKSINRERGVMVAYQTDLRGIKVHSEGWSSNLPFPANWSIEPLGGELPCHGSKIRDRNSYRPQIIKFIDILKK